MTRVRDPEVCTSQTPVLERHFSSFPNVAFQSTRARPKYSPARNLRRNLQLWVQRQCWSQIFGPPSSFCQTSSLWMHGDEGRWCGSFDIRRAIGEIEGSRREQSQWRAVIEIMGALWLLLVVVSYFEMERALPWNRPRVDRPQKCVGVGQTTSSTTITDNKDNRFELL